MAHFASRVALRSVCSVGRRSRRIRAEACAPIEALERRQLLSAATLAAVPPSIDPALAEQTLFAPGRTRLEVTPSIQGRLLSFTVDNVAFIDTGTFGLRPVSSAVQPDSALAIYDENGNLLKKIDSDVGLLAADLQTRRQYIVGLYFGPGGLGGDYALELTTGPQIVNGTIAIDPATGTATAGGEALEDSFNVPQDIDYYPLNLTNAALAGSITISPVGVGVQVAASLFWRPDGQSSWRPVASGADASGNPLILPAVPPVNGTLSDGQYLLSVAPVGFNTPARAYQVDVLAPSLIGPPLASGVSATDLLTVPPVSPGVAGLSRGDVLPVGGEHFFKFRAPSTGPLLITAATGAFDPAISVYDADGKLIAVATKLGGPASLLLPAVQHAVYTVRIADVGNDAGGTYSLAIDGTYEPTPVALAQPFVAAGSYAVGATQPGHFLRLEPAFGQELLLIETQSTAVGRLRVVRANAAPIDLDIPVGKKLFPIDLTSAPGTYDLFIDSANAGTVTLRIGQFDVPQFLPLGALPTAELALNGNTPLSNVSAGTFGTMRGVRFYQHDNKPGDSTLSVQGSGASVPLLAHYVADGASLKLASFALPSDTGLATISRDLGEFKLHGLATFALNFDGGGTSQYGVSGPELLPVGVGMVPDPPPPVPPQNPIGGNPTPPPPDPANFYSWLKIRNVVLGHDYERDYWATILPLNMIANPVVRVIPTVGSPLALDVDIYAENPATPGTLTYLGQINNAPGAMGTFTITSYASRQGHRIHFHVRPLSASIGDGMYTLEMQVQTTNPHPYEVTEPFWEVTNNNVIYSFQNSETWTDIIQNQFGDGWAQSSFTTSLPLRTGSVDVFRFWVQTPGPVIVRTIALSPTVNTNLKLYRALFDASGEIDRLVEMQDVPVSFDWYPADRSETDAQVYVNNYDLMRYAGTQSQYEANSFGMYFAVVKNQEGSTGNYRIEVDAPDFPKLGAAGTAANSFVAAKARTTAYIDPINGGSVQLRPQFTAGITDMVGYFPIQLPDYHSVNLTVSSSFGHWDFALFNENGIRLSGSETDHGGPIPFTSATFTVLSGPRTVYLRAREQSAVSNANAILTVANSVVIPPGTATPLPPAQVPNVVPRMLGTDPLGNATGSGATVSSTLFSNGEERAFAFKAVAGPLTVNVTPAVPGGVTLQWAVYVDGTLLAWDQTRMSGGVLDSSSLTTTLLLPRFRAAGLDPIEPYETAPIHDVVVYVKALTAPTAGGGGAFSVNVGSASTRPHRTGPDIGFDVLNAAPSTNITTDGTRWSRLFMPAHATTASLFVGSGGVGTSRYAWTLFDHTGAFVAGGVANPGLFGFANIALPMAQGGRMYYLRVGVEANATAQMSISASIALPKANGEKPTLINGSLENNVVRRVAPLPDGEFRFYTVQRPAIAQPNLVQYESFWVDQGGLVTIEGNWPTPGVNNFNTQNLTVAVYSISMSGGEFPQNVIRLVDYTNDSHWNAEGRYAMSLYLDPGAYLLRVISPHTNTSGGPVDYKLPAYRVEEAVVDPNFGTSALVHLQAVDNAVNWTTQAFRTRFVHAVAPAGTMGPFSALGVLYTAGSNPHDRDASLSLLRRNADGGYSYLGNSPGVDSLLTPPAPDTAAVQPSVLAEPGREYMMVLNRRSLAGRAGLGITFAVPVSGTPDLVVEKIDLSPNNGETRMDVKVHNIGYAPTLITRSLFQFTDTSKNPHVTTSAELLQMPIAPLGSYAWVLPWLPVRPTDWVQFTADHDNQVDELNEQNNRPAQPTLLSTVDAHRPTVTLSLRDPQMDGNAAPGVWGRYISGVNLMGEIVMTFSDPDNDLFRGLSETPYYMPAYAQSGALSAFGLAGKGPVTEYSIKNYNFGRLNPTSPGSPNVLRVQARDAYGLLSDWAEVIIQVMPMPNWLGADPSQITFNYDTRRYDIDFRNDVVRQEGTLDQITGVGIPFIGDKMNRFLIAIGAKGSVSLNPTQAVNIPLTAEAEILVLGATVLKEKWTGSAQPTNHFSISTVVAIDPLTINADQFNVTFRLTNLPLFNYKSPKIPLFAYGVPGIAAISANLSFSVNAYLNAALTVAIQTDPNDPLNVSRVGLAAPTFIMPTIQAGLTISGDVTFIGFDLASLYGSIFFGLNLGYGLPTTAPSFVPFLDFFNEAVLDITGSLSGEIGAEILGIEIFSIDFPTVNIDFTSGPAIQTMTSMAENLIGQGLAEAAQSLKGGGDPVGSLNIQPAPQIAIDPITGKALYVQVVDSDPGPAGRGVLHVATRQNGAWPAALSPLAGTGHATNPLLAYAGPNAGAVLVYQSHNSQTPHLLTRNQYLAGQEIRYRYYDGENWQPEQSLTNDSLFDSAHAMDFNDSGQGALAWVRNRNASPLDSDGVLDRDRNEIVVSRWDAATRTWLAPVALTNDNVGDAAPALHVAGDGTVLVVWKRDLPGGGTQLYYSRYAGGSWSALAALGVSGMPPGEIRSLAIGGDAAGNVSVIFGHAWTDPATKQVASRLFARTTTLAGFGGMGSLEEIANDANFGQLRTTNAPDGALIAYWQHATGEQNDIYAARIGGGSNTWSKPFPLTASAQIELRPSLAVEPNGAFALVYETVQPVLTSTPPLPPGPSYFPEPFPELPQVIFPDAVPTLPLPVPAGGGVGTALVPHLPELAFTRPMVFPFASKAAAGSKATAEATIINRGLQGTQVKIELLDITGGGEIGLNSQTIYLGPGSTFAIATNLTVATGVHTYAFRVSPIGSGEAFSSEDNISSAVLEGLPDIAVTSVIASEASPIAGQTVDIIAEVTNLSGLAIGSFDVKFTYVDPSNPNSVAASIGSATISLAPFETKTVKLPWVVVAGSHVITVFADANEVIAEATEFNNQGHLVITARPDVAIGNVNGDIIHALLATGKDNVQITGTVRNLGRAGLTNVPVHLLWSLDNGEWKVARTMILPNVPVGARLGVQFIADGLAGVNDYRIAIDPDNKLPDRDRSNNSAGTSIVIQGLPDLMVNDFQLDQLNPVQGQALNLTTTLYNLGIAKARHIRVEVIARPASGIVPLGLGGLVIGEVMVEELEALGQIDLVIPLATHQLSGAYELFLVVDRPQDILEVTDLNNEVSKRVNFQSGGNVIQATEGDDTIYVRLDSTGRTIQIWVNVPDAPNGAPTHQVGSTLDTPLTLASLGGNDRLIVDLANGVPIGPGGFYFNADGGFDRIILLGTAASEQFSVSDASILIGGRVLGHAYVERIEFDGNGGGDMLSVNSTIPVELNSVQVFSTLTLMGASRVDLRQGGDTLLVTSSLSIAPNATLDLADNAMIIHAAGGPAPGQPAVVLAMVTDRIASARNAPAGKWMGPGITTSMLAARAGVMGIGSLLNDQGGKLLYTTFEGMDVFAYSVLVRFTLEGDLDLSRRIDGDDYFYADRGYLFQPGNYFGGDVNYDQKTNASDYFAMDLAYLRQNAGGRLGAGASVIAPEAAPAAIPFNTSAPVPASAALDQEPILIDKADEDPDSPFLATAEDLLA